MGVTKEFRLFRKPSDSGGEKDWAIANDGEVLFGKTGATMQSRHVPAQSVSDRIVKKQAEGYTFLGHVSFNEDGVLVTPPTELEKPKIRPVPRRITWRCVPHVDNEWIKPIRDSIGSPQIMLDIKNQGSLKIEHSTDAALQMLHLLALKKAIDATNVTSLEISDPTATRSIDADPRKEIDIMALFGIHDFEEIRQVSEKLGLVMKPLEILVTQNEPCYDY